MADRWARFRCWLFGHDEQRQVLNGSVLTRCQRCGWLLGWEHERQRETERQKAERFEQIAKAASNRSHRSQDHA